MANESEEVLNGSTAVDGSQGIDPGAVVTSPRSKPRLITVFGARASGKDMWAVVLQIAANQASDLTVMFVGEETNKWLEDTKKLLRDGSFPIASDTPSSDAELRFITLDIGIQADRANGRPPIVTIQIPNAAGEWWTGDSQQRRSDGPDPFTYLADSDGIVCLVDSTEDHVSYRKTAFHLETMLDRLHSYRRDRDRTDLLRIALCLTKIDHPQHWRYRGQEEDYARVLFGENLIHQLEQMQKTGHYLFKWGSCSAIGRVQEAHGQRDRSNAYWNYAVERYRIYKPQSVRPLGIIEPLVWLLQSCSAEDAELKDLLQSLQTSVRTLLNRPLNLHSLLEKER